MNNKTESNSMTPDKMQIIQYQKTLDLVMLPDGLRIRDNVGWHKIFPFKQVVYDYMNQQNLQGPEGPIYLPQYIARLAVLSKDLHELTSQCDMALQKIDPTPA